MKKLIFIIMLLIPFVLNAQTKLTYKTSEVQTLLDKSKNSQVGVFNVLDYGAVGDSITDDTQAIKDAVAAVSSAGGTVFFPVGKYKITSQILIHKPINLKGVPVAGYVTAAGYNYKAGSILYSSGSAMAMVLIKSATTGVEWRSPIIENLHFIDNAGVNDTLLVIRLLNNARIYNCTFSLAAVGVKIDPMAEDAHLAQLNNNNFWHNKTGISVLNGPAASGVPPIHISGGNFFVDANQTGIYTESSTMTIMSDFRMDVAGTHSIGINTTGSKVSIADVKIEMNGADATTIGILTHGPTSISGVGIQGDSNFGIGIYLYQGASYNDPNAGNVISNTQISLCDIGILLDDTTQANIITNCYLNSQATANIQSDAGSKGNYFNSIVSNNDINDVTGGLLNNGTDNTIINYVFSSGGTRAYHNMIPFKEGTLTDGTPTDAELDAALGMTPASAGKGYQTIIKDDNGTYLLYFIVSTGSVWMWMKMTEAL